MKEIINRFVTHTCQNWEEFGLDNPIEEGYLADFDSISGASAEEIEDLEKHFGISLPAKFKEVYAYKNGSANFNFLPQTVKGVNYHFQLYSLEQIKKSKQYFQNRNALLTDFPDFFSQDDLDRLADGRMKPYLFNEKWIPFAEYFDCYLMLDFDPTDEGQAGQILFYQHDPDEVYYVAPNLSSAIDRGLKAIEDKN